MVNKKFKSYILEGSAEKFIIETLINNNLLKDEYLPFDDNFYELITVHGVGNLNIAKWKIKTNLSLSAKKIIVFNIIGDNFVKFKPNFISTTEHEQVEKELLEIGWEIEIKTIEIYPEPEYLIMLKFDLQEEYEKVKSNKSVIKFLAEKLKCSKNKLKSYEYWVELFPDHNELSDLIKKLKKDKKSKHINIRDIIK